MTEGTNTNYTTPPPSTTHEKIHLPLEQQVPQTSELSNDVIIIPIDNGIEVVDQDNTEIQTLITHHSPLATTPHTNYRGGGYVAEQHPQQTTRYDQWGRTHPRCTSGTHHQTRRWWGIYLYR